MLRKRRRQKTPTQTRILASPRHPYFPGVYVPPASWRTRRTSQFDIEFWMIWTSCPVPSIRFWLPNRTSPTGPVAGTSDTAYPAQAAI